MILFLAGAAFLLLCVFAPAIALGIVVLTLVAGFVAFIGVEYLHDPMMYLMSLL